MLKCDFYKLKRKGSNKDLYTSVSADDSSDEEEQVESYDIIKQIKLYSSSKWNLERKVIDQNNILSFITHAAGIYILYSPSVQVRYYELKKEKLLSTLQLKNDADIKEEIELNFKEIKYWAGKEGRNKNRDIVNILDVIKTDMYSKIVEDKISYMEAYQTNNGIYFIDFIESLFQKNNLELEDVRNFRISDYFLDPVKNFTRKTLDTPDFDLSTVPEECFVTEFLAHLRLHNRSQKRHLNNEEECKNTSWKIFELKERILLDNKNDSEKYWQCRNEQVFIGGNKWSRYVDILNNLTPEERQVLLDKRINIKKASEVEDNLNSENLSLWYLLFGCEVLRNPAAIIHHNMVFDLIKSEKLKWGEEMIKFTPMLTTGVIQKAMRLNQDYDEFMPHKYLYQYMNDYEAGDLVMKEANITKAWLQFKLGEGASSNLINNCTTDNNAVQRIWQLIMESFDGWGLRSVLTQSNNDKRSKNDERTQLVQDPENVNMLDAASLMLSSSPINPHQVQSDTSQSVLSDSVASTSTCEEKKSQVPGPGFSQPQGWNAPGNYTRWFMPGGQRYGGYGNQGYGNNYDYGYGDGYGSGGYGSNYDYTGGWNYNQGGSNYSGAGYASVKMNYEDTEKSVISSHTGKVLSRSSDWDGNRTERERKKLKFL